MIVLDTDVLSTLQRGAGDDYDRLVRLLTRHVDEQPALTNNALLISGNTKDVSGLAGLQFEAFR